MKSTLHSLFILCLVVMIPFRMISQTTCSAPTNLTTTNISNTGTTLQWTAAAGAVAYIVQYRAGTSSATAWINVTSQSSSVTLTNLTCTTAYEWHVATVCSTVPGGTSPYSAMSYFTTTACTTTCIAPAALTTGNISTTGAMLVWTPVTGAVAYLVQYHTGGGAWINVTTQSPSITLTNLICGTAYEWHVATICSTVPGGTSSYSAAVAFTTLPCTTNCAAPTSPATTNITTTGATLLWVGATGGLAYIVQYRPVTTPAAAWISVTVTNPNSTLTLTNLTCGTHYEWQVQTYCGNGVLSTFSGLVDFTTAACTPVCPMPASLTTTNITQTGATLTWIPTPSGSGAGYIVQYHAITLPASAWINVTAQTNSVTLTNLTCGTHYEWHVATVCNGTISQYSATVDFTTTACTTTCTAPSGLTTTNISTTGATLSWVAPGAAYAYIVQYRPVTNPASAWISTSTQTGTSITLTSLVCGTHYEWQVQTYCGNGVLSTFSALADFTTTACTTNCIMPTGLTTGNITTTGATLSWTPVTGAVGYIVQYHAGGATWINVTTQSASITLTNLTCGTAYEWHVATICSTASGNTSPYSTAISFTTQPCSTPCIPPVTLTTTNITTTGATLSWVAPSGGLAYNVQYRPITTPASAWISITTQTGTSVTLTNLLCGTHYEWQVQTYCGNAVLSIFSAIVDFTTPACTTTCIAPSALTTGNISTTGATLAWTPVTGTVGYLVQYHSLTPAGSPWINITTQSASVTLTNLTCGTSYEWHVATICSTAPGNTSPYAAAIHFTTEACAPPCVAPTGLITTNITSTGATLIWVGAAGGVAYIVQYHPITTPASAWTSVTVTNPNSTLALTNLACGTHYEWHVAAYCNNNTGTISPYSVTVDFTTTPCTTNCEHPSGLTTTNITTTGATLSWTGPAGGLAYIVQYHAITSPASVWINVTTQANSIALTNLTCGTHYEWQVQTYCGNGITSAYSATFDFTTATCTAPTCIAPSTLTIANITTTGATLVWTPVPGAVGYIVQYHVGGATWLNVTTQSTSVSLTNLTCGTTYEWHVATVCGTTTGNISPYSAATHFTTTACTTNCVAPSGPSTTNISTTGATLLWIAPAGGLAYVVQYGPVTASGTAWTNVTTQSTSVTVTNLVCGTHYQWHVQTYCGSAATNLSPYSVTIDFTTLPCTNNVCPIPVDLTSAAVSASSTSRLLSWNPTGALAYNIRYRITNTATWTTTTSTTSSKTITGLQLAGHYEWQVQSICSTNSGTTGISAWSASAFFETPLSRAIFPNPASGRSIQLPIITENDARISIMISDGMGRIIRTIDKTIAPGGEIVDIDIANLETGMYFIKISNEGKNEVQKLFITR